MYEISKYTTTDIKWDFYEAEEQNYLYYYAFHHKHGNHHASYGKHEKG
jgi:hypothetical protein